VKAPVGAAIAGALSPLAGNFLIDRKLCGTGESVTYRYAGKVWCLKINDILMKTLTANAPCQLSLI